MKNKKELTSQESEKYIEIVKNGNMDDMFDFGFEVGFEGGKRLIIKDNKSKINFQQDTKPKKAKKMKKDEIIKRLNLIQQRKDITTIDYSKLADQILEEKNRQIKQEQTRRKQALLKQAEAFKFILKQEKERLLERIKLEKKLPEVMDDTALKIYTGYQSAIIDLEKLKNQLKNEK